MAQSCNFKKTDHGTYQCARCGYSYDEKYGPDVNRTPCRPLKPMPATPKKEVRTSSGTWPNGPGDYLHRLIKKFTGNDYQAGCGCEDMVFEMNAWGPGGCRTNLETIVDKMVAAAEERKWDFAIPEEVPYIGKFDKLLSRPGMRVGRKIALQASVKLGACDGIRCMVIVAINLAEHGEAACKNRVGNIVDEVISRSSPARALPGHRAVISKMVGMMVVN